MVARKAISGIANNDREILGSRGNSLAEDSNRRAAEETKVESKRPTPCVGHVHVQRLAEARSPPSRNLPEPREARGHEKPLEVVGLEMLVIRYARPRNPTSDMSPLRTLIS